jgi:arginyl-tRNA synthetase
MNNAIELKLKQALIDAVAKAFEYVIEADFVVIEIPKDTSFGDYASNVAMRLAKPLKSNPKLIAEKIIEKLDYNQASVQEARVAGPGFINVFIKQEALANSILKILELKENYGRVLVGASKKVNLEYVSANPTGDLHPGHARGAAIGDSVARIMDFAGFDVTREYYVNDAGNQINNMAKSLQARYYQAFNIMMEVPKDGYFGQDLVDIAQQLKDQFNDSLIIEDPNENLEVFKAYGLKAELDKIKEDLKTFNVEFDVYSSEQNIRDRGLVEKVLERLEELDMIYQSESATWLKTTNFNDDKDRVLVKSDGTYTYLLPDIAYHLDKVNRGCHWMIDFLGADHHGYITRLTAAVEALQVNAHLEIDIIQMARMIKDGEEFKLSKRSGKAVALKDLIEIAGKDAIRYYFVSKAADTHMDLDLDMATKQSNENPVYYAQYAHARVCSILSIKGDLDIANSLDLINHPKEIELMKHLNEFPSVVSDSALTRQPHKIANYIQKVAQLFHSFYNECYVLDKEKPELSSQRLTLVLAVKITLANALNLIGVFAPEKM